MQDQFKYFAFISYNSKDTAWGKKLQKKLEHYRMPATLCSEHNWQRTPIKPVFFAPTDIQPGGLSEELQERLKASQNLIVICSPNSAKSQWVGREIEFFHNLGRTKNIHFFIVDGIPHSGDPETECFNPVVNQLGLPEILGANIHEKNYKWPWLNKERAYVQLVSKLLGVEFDAIWQRHKRQLIRKAVVWTVGIIAVLCALLFVWRANQPVDVNLKLNESSVHNENLPPLKDAVVTMTLDNEIKIDTLESMDGNLVFNNIPHRYLNQEVRFSVSCPNYVDTDTSLLLTPNVTLNIARNDSVFGKVNFRIYNPNEEMYVGNTTISLAGQETVSDPNGRVSLFVPLEKQQRYYIITGPLLFENDTVYMPSGKDDVVLIQ
ncbi:MAG: toll/interleukin-1 receptor domain-containing protein [Bacteroidales bacterium]|nr:toll/interleukin-1 receptor domain-containing protein [Bacteroidales bacterium]